jgi:hypothetical protein
MVALAIVGWLLIFFLFLLSVVGCYISEFFQKIWHNIKCLWFSFRFWLNDSVCWSSDMHGRGGYTGLKVSVHERMNGLIRELIKHLYCKDVLGNPPLTEEAYQKRLDALRKLESQYSGLKRKCSPTQYNNFREDMAIEAYGSGYYDWKTVKDTLQLTIEGYPKPKELIIINKTEDYGY